MLITKLLFILASIGSQAGYWDHKCSDNLYSMLDEQQMGKYIMLKYEDKELQEADEKYVKGFFEDDGYYVVVINFHKYKPALPSIPEDEKKD